MFESSTPDGLAPIGTIALIVFICAIGGLSMLWGISNLIFLLRFIPQGQNSQKMQRVFQLNRKMLRGALDIVKLDLIVGLLATVIFFLLIMGTVEHFHSFFYSLAFILGSLNSIIIAIVSVVVSCLVKPRIINFARFSLYDAFDSAKRAANFQSYFFIGETIFAIGLFLVIYQRHYDIQLKDRQQLQRVAKSLVCFSFGSATIAIGSRIINAIYSKGADFAMETLNMTKDRLRKDQKHPALIAKALGQIVNKSLSSVLDSVVYLSAGVALTIYAATYNIIGADQKGEIVFQFSISNCYLPILSFLFSLFYNLLFNVLTSLVIRPSTGEGVRTVLSVQRYAAAILLTGFQALAAYLCLPAQFFVDEVGQYLRHPYHAYLPLLFGLLLSTFTSTVAQILATHPFFINSLSNSCKTGSATNIIYGLSFGYLFNFIPTIFIAGTLFLSIYWIGTYGVGLLAIGYLSLLPHYLYGQLLYSYLQNSSFICYISQLDQSVTQSLIEAAKTRKDYQPHVNQFLYGFICCLGCEMVLVFIESAQFTGSTSLKSPTIFLGLLVGAMFPYFYNASLLRSIYKCGPAISYDINMQIEQIPAMATGNMDPDFVRTSSLFSFQCVLSLKRFVPVLIGPIVVIGIAGGPSLVVGFLCGVVISGVQLGMSSGMSGCAWSTVKKQISFNNVRDQEGNTIKPDSDWARAADVGNLIGQNLKDCSSPSIPIMMAFWGLQSFALASLYKSIHP